MKNRRKAFRRFFLFTLILVLSYILLFKTDYFNIKRVEVHGNKKLSYDVIVKASLCNKGENIFRVNTSKGEESLERLAYIKKSEIKRKLPSKIIIQVEEREEIAIIPYLNSVALIDKEGYILSIEKDDKSIKLPRIKGFDKMELKAGENIFQMAKKDNIEEFISTAHQLSLLANMTYVDFSNEKNIIFQINNDTNVDFGSLDNVKYKLDFLIKIIEDVDKKGVKAKHIFFNKGDNPIIVTDNR